MNDALMRGIALAAGAGLGAIFFGGLWWTVRRGLASDRPALWFLGSLLVRMSLVLTGFYFVTEGRWDRLLLSLLGFFLARLAVTWFTSQRRKSEPLAPESPHAS